MGIMAAHGVPYAASASISDPQDLKAKVKKAMSIKGTRFIHLLASCPTGWRHAPELTIEVARQAIKSRIFPLYEIEDGEKWLLNAMPEKESIESYLNAQGRFKNMTPDMMAAFQENVDADWNKLVNKCQGALNAR